jgi:hypothetical protein
MRPRASSSQCRMTIDPHPNTPRALASHSTARRHCDRHTPAGGSTFVRSSGRCALSASCDDLPLRPHVSRHGDLQRAGAVQQVRVCAWRCCAFVVVCGRDPLSCMYHVSMRVRRVWLVRLAVSAGSGCARLHRQSWHAARSHATDSARAPRAANRTCTSKPCALNPAIFQFSQIPGTVHLESNSYY